MKKIIINLIRAYQQYISPHFGLRCRFYPSCSEYAILAIEKYGLLWGFTKAVYRVLRCNPLCRGGIDYP